MVQEKKSLLKVNNLQKYFTTPQGIVKAVDDVSFAVAPGETLGLVGESGSGKTTAAFTIIGAYQPTDGSIYFQNKQISGKKRSRELKRNIQIVFQDPGSSLNPRQSVRQILTMPLKLHNVVPAAEIGNKIQELLELVELPRDFIHKHPLELGEGEKQSVAIARALSVNPSLIVLDEPTSALDVSMQAKIIKLLGNLQQEFNVAYIFITHDLSLMRNVASRVAIMYLGRICEIARAADFFQQPLHPYTRMLISSVPVVSEEEEALKPPHYTSQGEIPSPVNMPTGCGFHPRCPEKLDICDRQIPESLAIDNNRQVFCHLYRKDQEQKIADSTLRQE